jgi:hypothetical protein
MKKQNNQKGFTAFELVIIIVALISIGTAGYFAYQARQDKTDYSVTVPKKQAAKPSSSSTPSISYLTVKEWGIKVPQQPTGNILSYRIESDIADFVSSEQKALGGDCGQFSSARYHVYRMAKDSTTNDDILAAKLKAATDEGLDLLVGNYKYYILSDMSGGVCADTPSDGSAVSQKEQTANLNLRNALKGLRPIN